MDHTRIRALAQWAARQPYTCPDGQWSLGAALVQLLLLALGLRHSYLAYAISFLVIGIFWSAHHRKFRYIRRYDSGLVMLNLLLLMVIAFVPSPSSLLAESSNRTATVFYALTMMLAGLLLAAI